MKVTTFMYLDINNKVNKDSGSNILFYLIAPCLCYMAVKLVINLSEGHLGISNMVIIALLIFPLVYKFTEIAFYFLLFEWFLDIAILYEVGGIVSERILLGILLIGVLLIKNNFNILKMFDFKEPVHILMFMFLLCITTSYIFKGDDWMAPLALNGYLRMLVTYIIVINLTKTPMDVEKFLWAFIFIILAFALSGFATYVFTPLFHKSIITERLMSTAEPNTTAMYCVLALPLALFELSKKRSNIIRFFLICAIMVLIMSILFTGSRTGFIGLIFCIVLMMLPALNKANKGNKRNFIIGVLIFSIVGLILSLGPATYFERYSTIFKFAKNVGSPISSELLIDTRVERAKAGIEMFLSHPLTGVGLGNYMYLAPQLALVTYGQSRQQAHNEYIRLASELGLVGIAIFIPILLYTIVNFRRSANIFFDNGNPNLCNIANVFLISFLCLLVMNLVLNHLLYIKITYYFVALSVNLKNMALKEKHVL